MTERAHRHAVRELLRGTKRDPERPFTLDDRRKDLSVLPTRREEREVRVEQLRRLRANWFTHAAAGDREGALLLARRLPNLLASANLTSAEMEIAGLRLQGFSFAAIGARRGHTKQYAKRLWDSAALKLREAYESDGAAEVYLEMTRLG